MYLNIGRSRRGLGVDGIDLLQGLHACWDWCRLPASMKCVCLDSGPSYERLSPLSPPTTMLDFTGCTSGCDKDSNNEKQEELTFYNDDGSWQQVVVERNLRASDLCQLLMRKNRFPKDQRWSLYEYWVDLGLERPLEDHEDVLRAHRDMESYSRRAERRFIFRKDLKKYDFFRDPGNYFPTDMVNPGSFEEIADIDFTGVKTILDDGECPHLFSHVWVKGPNKQVWAKAFLLLIGQTLYLTQRVQVVAKFLRTPPSKNNISIVNDLYGTNKDDSQLQPFARVTDYHVYSTLNAKNHFRAPTEFGLCLRPLGEPPLDSQGSYKGPLASIIEPGLRCIACDSERERSCWLTAMRLAKYGKQLRENYRAFKNKGEPMPGKDYNSYTVPNESIRSRVAMDFTGSVGRIVEDPQEARAIAAAEGYSWKRRWRPSPRCHLAPPHGNNNRSESRGPSPPEDGGLGTGVHLAQPWFHSGMTREQAAALVARHGTVDGVFLVRESRSAPTRGHFVLTYRCGAKVLHAHIQPLLDPVRGTHVYSLDSGVTKFYDLLQLVEFYQLNAGCLPTRLTHYVVQQARSPDSVPAPLVGSC